MVPPLARNHLRNTHVHLAPPFSVPNAHLIALSPSTAPGSAMPTVSGGRKRRREVNS